jgi:5-enolpyruvylshikimate-3-phosphate synthase
MSSHFLSSLLMTSPAVDDAVTITIKDELIFAPYVVLTTGLMHQFGVDVEVEDNVDDGTPSFCITTDANYAST